MILKFWFFNYGEDSEKNINNNLKITYRESIDTSIQVKLILIITIIISPPLSLSIIIMRERTRNSLRFSKVQAYRVSQLMLWTSRKKIKERKKISYDDLIFFPPTTTMIIIIFIWIKVKVRSKKKSSGKYL